MYFCFIEYAKAFHCVDHNKLWEILKDMGIPGHLICLPRNLYAGQEATVRTGHGPTNKERSTSRLYIVTLLICTFTLSAEYIMGNARMDEAQVGIKIAGRNINNFRCSDDTTQMAEREEELKSLLMMVKEESEKASLELNIPKTNIMACSPITSCQRDGEKWKQ